MGSDGVQVVEFNIVSETDGFADFLVELVEVPEGWTHCPNEPATKRPRFELLDHYTLFAEFHFSNICLPGEDDGESTIWLPYTVRWTGGD